MVEADVSAGSGALGKGASALRGAVDAPEGPGSPGFAPDAGQCHTLLPDAPGANGTVTFSVGLASRREVSLHWTYRDGKPSDGGVGSPPSSDLTLSVDASEAARIFAGLVAPSVAFMRGRLKTSGDDALALAFLRSTVDPGFSRWLRKVGELVSLERSS